MRVAGVFLLVIFCTLIVTSEVVNASDAHWTASIPVVYQDRPTSYLSEQPCPTYYQDMSIKGVPNTRRSCQFGGDPLQISRFLQSNGKNALAVKLPLSDVAHKLEGICEGQPRCLYSADEDILVTNFSIGSNQIGLELFRHVDKRISVTLDPSTISNRYVFDSSGPDYVFKDVNGVALMAESFALSENGRWLAVELKNHGTALVDTRTLEAKRIIPTGPEYGFGLDPVVEMAVSDDGANIAVAGQNSSFNIAEVVGGCGEPLVKEKLSEKPTGADTCPHTRAGVGNLTPASFTVFHPRFDEGSRQLSFLLVPRNLPARFIVFRSADFHADTKQYIALGDSFSSGEGETGDDHYKSGTDRYPDMCHVSDRSYPFLLASAIGISDQYVGNVACSGAKLLDVITNGQDYLGQGDRLGPEGLGLSSSERLQESLSALNSLSPGRIPQSRFVDYYRPELVTVGIGGNDAGLMTKLRSCAMPGTCDWVGSEERFRTAEEIRSLFDRLVGLYIELSNLSPGTLLYAVGYPLVIEPEGSCDPITAALLNREERFFMDESLRYLNKVIESAAAKAGIGYIDVEDSYEGHRLCGGSSSPAMNGLRLGDDISVINPLPMLKLIGNETFHPTPLGHSLASRAILSRYGDLRTYRWCADGHSLCPTSGSAPAPPAYWGYLSNEGAKLRQVDFASYSSQPNGKIRIALPSRTLLPESEASFVLHSDPKELGSLVAGSDGSLTGYLTVVTDAKVGIHTLRLDGKTYDGKNVELYQEVLIQGPTASDNDSPSALTVRSVHRKPSNNQAPDTLPSGKLGVLGSRSPNTSQPTLANDSRNLSFYFFYLWAIVLVPLVLVVAIAVIVAWLWKS